MNKRIFLLALVLPGCSGGCDSPRKPPQPMAAPAPAAPPAPAVAPQPPDLNATVEHELNLQLPERRSGVVLPGLQTLPYRRLREFDPAKNLVLRVTQRGLSILEKALPIEQLQNEQALTEILRWAQGQWATRTGLAPIRLVLVADKSMQPQQMAVLRRVALTTGTWRLVALARDGEVLVELALNPPPERRPETVK